MKVECLKQGSVWRIGLAAAPEPRVLIDPGGLEGLFAVLEESAADRSCRVLILEGSKASFCEGLDLEAVLGLGAPELKQAVRGFADCLQRLRQARQVVIAVVEGAAAGGGLGLAAAADQLLAAPTASFVLPELALGLLPAVVLPVLLQRLSLQRVRLLALGERLGAEQALGLGLVDRLCPAAELERELRAAVKQALRLRPDAVGELKALGAEMTCLPLGAALELGVDRTATLLADQDRVETLRAFLQGESLPWFERWRP